MELLSLLKKRMQTTFFLPSAPKMKNMKCNVQTHWGIPPLLTGAKRHLFRWCTLIFSSMRATVPLHASVTSLPVANCWGLLHLFLDCKWEGEPCIYLFHYANCFEKWCVCMDVAELLEILTFSKFYCCQIGFMLLPSDKSPVLSASGLCFMSCFTPLKTAWS